MSVKQRIRKVTVHKREDGFFTKPKTRPRKIEELVRQGVQDDDIPYYFPNVSRSNIVQLASRLREMIPVAVHVPTILVLTAEEAELEIRRLHFERHLPLTQIAALLHVPYRQVMGAIGPRQYAIHR